MNQIDTTTQSGDPVELFNFKQGSLQWFVANSAYDLVFQSNIYLAEPVKRSTIDSTGDVFKSVLQIEFALDSVFASQFLGFTPDVSTTIDVYRVSSSDPSGDYITIWKGRIMDAKTSGGIITLECEPIHTSMQAIGLRARYERACRHLLYSRGCSVKMEFNEYYATVVDLPSANKVVVDLSKSDGFFNAGIIELGNTSMRYITSQVGDTLTLSRPFQSDGIAIGDSIKLFPGCDQTKETCDSKFNNLLNFGGWSYIPTQNPFEGNPF